MESRCKIKGRDTNMKKSRVGARGPNLKSTGSAAEATPCVFVAAG